MRDTSSEASFGKSWGGLLRVWSLVLSVALVLALSHGACNCNGDTNTNDGGATETVPEKTVSSQTQIRFISPEAKTIISGQITIEAEVIDADGMDTVQFWANDKAIGVGTKTRDSTNDSPRYSVQVATSFLPRGILSLTVRTRDLKGETAEKTIQVTTRERWVAAFGVGTVNQMHIRKDRHIYIRIYRSEDDMSRVLNPGPRDKVGSALVTSNAVGGASWMYLGPNEEFGPFVADETGNLFFGSRTSETGKSRFLALGPGNVKWGPEVEIKPKWEVDLKDWIAQGDPIRWSQWVWTVIQKPAQGGEPSASALVKMKAEDGAEEWRYTGPEGEKMEVLRGPYLVDQGSMLIVTRKAGSSSGFRVELIDPAGKQIWLKAYNNQRLNVATWDKDKVRLFIGVEQREGTKVTASAVIAIDPVGQSEMWRKEFGSSWPQRISLGQDNIFVHRDPEGATNEVLSMTKEKGDEVWKKVYDRHKVSGLQGIEGDTCFVFVDYLNDFDEPDQMFVERIGPKGDINWRYENKQFSAKRWMFVPQLNDTLYVIVRGITDESERLGSKLLALDSRGKRLYLFLDEGRVFQYMAFFPRDSIFITSRDLRDARVHHLIPVE